MLMLMRKMVRNKSINKMKIHKCFSHFYIEFPIHFIKSIWNVHIKQFNTFKKMIKMQSEINLVLLLLF